MKTPTTILDPLFSVALQHALKNGLNAKAREEVGPGVHSDIELTLTVRVGEMRVAEDTDKAPTCSIPMLAAMALLVKRMGFQREKAFEVLQEVMTEAIKLGKDASSTLLAETGVADAEKAIKTEVIAKLPRTPVKGAVKVSNVEVDIKSMSIKS